MPTLSDILSQTAQSPARPVSPTPMTQSGIADALYGSGTPSSSWLPPNVQNYMRTQPSYGEGDSQGMPLAQIQGAEPNQPSAPQIEALQQLFNENIARNAATSNPTGGLFLKNIIQAGRLAGGVEI